MHNKKMKHKYNYNYNYKLPYSTVLYGIINSRRLGKSLGINLFSDTIKGCNFDCVYCQYGRTSFSKESFLSTKKIKDEISNFFILIKNENIEIDSITLAGNGEPTLHPDYIEILEYIKLEKENLLPNIPISLFTNATLLNKKEIRNSLKLIDNKFIKIDAIDQHSFNKMGGKGNFSKIIKSIINTSKEFDIDISTAVIKEPDYYSNYSELSSKKFADIINKINPKRLLLYSINKQPAEIEIKRVNNKDLLQLQNVLKEMIKIPIEIYE